MLFDSIKMVDGSEVSNLTVASGTAFPAGSAGDLYFRTDLNQFFVNNGTTWVPQLNEDSDLTSLLPDIINPNTFSIVTVNSKGLVTGGSKPTTLAGYGITDAQPLDGDLSSIAALSGNFGTLKKLANNSWTLDTNPYLTSNQNISISGDAIGSGTSAISLTLATTGVTSGSYGSPATIPSFNVDSKGRISLATNNTPSIDASSTTSGTFNNLRISESNVTQHQAALSINESQITNANILARIASNEAITGTWSFSSPITGVTPVSGSHLTTKDYVDNVAAGVSPHLSVLTSSTVDITLSGTQILDGVSTQVGTRVLVKDQTDASQNGVYVVSSGAWSRATDFDGSPTNEVSAGDLVYVESGTLNGNSSWILVTYGTITLGTTPLTFSVFSRPGELLAGDGLIKSANTFSVGTASTSRIVVNADSIDLALTGVAGGTYSSLTIDAYGRVTAASISQPWANVSGTPSTLVGYGINDAQPLSNILSSISSLSSTGILVKTASGSTATRTVLVTGTGLSINNANGVSGDITVSSNATSDNIPSTLISRDLSGNFSANSITASLIGNATTASTVTSAAQPSITSVGVLTSLDVTGPVTAASFNGITGLTNSTPLLSSGSGAVGVGTLAARDDHVHPEQTVITGNAATATILQTARTINGVSFNGSANITINAVDSTSRVASSLLGVANGVATLDSTGKVPTTQLPSYVDDVIEATNLAAFPATGESGKIYVALDTNKTYRWSGSAYVYITSGAVDSVAGKTGVVTLVKADVGLANVDNTADSAKSVNYAVTSGTAGNITGTYAGTITSGQITTGLGFTPYNATNPSGYITSAGSISGNAATATYLSATQQINAIVGKSASMAMNPVDASQGSFTCRSTGTGDANLAGVTFWNDSYGIKLGIRSDGYFGLGSWSRAAWSWYSDPSGNMVAAGNVTAYSDPRLKENFKRIQNPLEMISKLDGGSFDWKYGFEHTALKAGKHDYGILADQVYDIMPEIVTDSIEINGEKYKTVDYSKLVPLLIEAVKELQAEIEKLKNK